MASQSKQLKETLLSHLPVILFTGIYTAVFTIVFVYQESYEFLWYTAVLVLFALLIGLTLHRSKFDSTILWGLSVWGLLHLAGGGVPAGEGVLYGFTLIPLVDFGKELVFLKYDQAVHFYGFGVATLVVYHLIRPYLANRIYWPVIFGVVVLAGMGLGVVNEIVEFIAVLVMPETGVGGYNNTLLDLVFNTLGAVAAGLYVVFYREQQVYASRYGFFSKLKRFLHLPE